MKKVISTMLLVILLFSGCSISDTPDIENTEFETESTMTATLSDKLDAIVNSYKFNGVASVFYEGDKIYESVSGYADKDTDRVNSSKDVYRIASISKEFTATAVCMLYEAQKLDLDDTVDKYFQKAKFGDKVTVKDLLNMSSGIPDYTGDYKSGFSYKEEDLEFEITADNSADENKSAIESWILSQELNFEPQEKFEYSNSNYFLLGRIVEIVSGMTYEDFITENIIEPLNLKHTGFSDDILTTKGYVYDSVKSEEEYFSEIDNLWTLYPGVDFAMADINSSVDDLYKWITSLRKGDIVKIETFEKMVENNGLGFGMGFFVNDVACYNTGHLGAFVSYLGFARQQDFVVITLSNTFNSGMNYADIGVQLGNVAMSELR